MQLESELVELELDRDRHSKASRNAREKLTELESDRKELADEYVVLKTNFINLQRAHEAEVSEQAFNRHYFYLVFLTIYPILA